MDCYDLLSIVRSSGSDQDDPWHSGRSNTSTREEESGVHGYSKVASQGVEGIYDRKDLIVVDNA